MANITLITANGVSPKCWRRAKASTAASCCIFARWLQGACELIGGPILVLVCVGQHTGSVNAQCGEVGKFQVDRQLDHLFEDVAKFVRVLAAKLAERLAVGGWFRLTYWHEPN